MLKGAGQKLGASAALCHIRRVTSSNHSNQYTLHLANVGDVEVVLCRRGEAVVLTRKFVTTDDDEECLRVYQSDGIITEVRGQTIYDIFRLSSDPCFHNFFAQSYNISMSAISFFKSSNHNFIFPPLETISTSLWAGLHHHFPASFAFSHDR